MVVPMYRVSPQLLVTSEHIISASVSSSFPSSAVSLGSGDAVPLLGLGSAGWIGVAFAVDCAVWDMAEVLFSSVLCLGVADRPARSASRFSNVARSVLPSSSSGRTPERRINDSMRARRFSRPSMYLALCVVSPVWSRMATDGTYPLGGCLFFSTWVKIHSVL